MQAAKRIQSRALLQMASATKKYPRFFHPHEVKSIDDLDSWESVDGDDPDVFLVPSGLIQTTETPSGHFSQRLAQITEESGVYNLGSASTPPEAAGVRDPLPSVRPTVPFRQPSRPEYADAAVLSIAPATQLGIGPELLHRAMMDAKAAFAPRVMTPVPLEMSPHLMSSPIASAVLEPLPPSSQPLEGYLYAPSSTAGAVMSVNQPPPSLLATMTPQNHRSYGIYLAGLAAFALAASGIFGGSHLMKGHAHDAAAAIRAPAVENALAPAPPASNEAPPMDLGAALANTTLGQAPPAPAAPAPVASATKPAAAPSAGPAKREPAAVRAKAALLTGDLSTASLIYSEMTDTATTRLEGAVGLAEVSHARGDNRVAVMRFREILVNYPAYLPARLGLADATWDTGDLITGSKLYGGLQRQYSTKLLPPRVAERAKL